MTSTPIITRRHVEEVVVDAAAAIEGLPTYKESQKEEQERYYKEFSVECHEHLTKSSDDKPRLTIAWAHIPSRPGSELLSAHTRVALVDCVFLLASEYHYIVPCRSR